MQEEVHSLDTTTLSDSFMETAMAPQPRGYREHAGWAITAAFVCFGLYGLLGSIVGFGLEDTSRSYMPVPSFLVLVGSAVILAPLMEEFMFRGVFTRRRWLRIVAATLLGGFSLMTVWAQPWWFIGITMVIYVAFLLFLYTSEGDTTLLRIAFVLSTFLFGFMHYSSTDLSEASKAISILIHMGLGFGFLAVYCYLGIWASIIGHFLWNGFAIAMLAVGLYVGNTEVHNVETEDAVLEISPRAAFNGEVGHTTFPYNRVHGENVDMNQLLGGFAPDEFGTQYVPTLQFAKYDVNLRYKDSFGLEDRRRIALDLLVEAGALRKID